MTKVGRYEWLYLTEMGRKTNRNPRATPTADTIFTAILELLHSANMWEGKLAWEGGGYSVAMAQVSMKKGFQMFGKKKVDAVTK